MNWWCIMLGKFSKEEIRKYLKEGMSINEIVMVVMKLGKEIVDEVGNKNYSSEVEFYNDIHGNESPLAYVDDYSTTDVEGAGANIITVKNCKIGETMADMLANDDSDLKVDEVLKNFQTGDNLGNCFLDIGCFISQQIRQMIISSMTVNGKYVFNYIHLGCKRGGNMRLCKREIEAVGLSEEQIEHMLENCECIYAISHKESEN